MDTYIDPWERAEKERARQAVIKRINRMTQKLEMLRLEEQDIRNRLEKYQLQLRKF